MAPPLVRLFATWLLLVPAAGIVSAAPLSVPLSRVWSPGVAHSLDRSLGPGPDDFTKDFVTFLVYVYALNNQAMPMAKCAWPSVLKV